MKQSIILILLVFLFILFSCKTNKNGSEWFNDPGFLNQKILFEVEYENYAWGHYHYGKYIDNEGDIYEYDLSNQAWKPSNYYYLTEQELLKKFNDKQKIGSIDVDILYEKYKQSQSLSNSDLTEWQDTGWRDWGIVVYSAYKFDMQGSIYERIVLYAYGDALRMNSSANGQSITQWLSQWISLGPGVRGVPGSPL